MRLSFDVPGGIFSTRYVNAFGLRVDMISKKRNSMKNRKSGLQKFANITNETYPGSSYGEGGERGGGWDTKNMPLQRALHPIDFGLVRGLMDATVG